MGIPGNFEAGADHLGRGGINVNNDTLGSIGILGNRYFGIYRNTWGSIRIPGNFEAGAHHLGRDGITVNNDIWDL